jgi:diguanylate cyclase (GGDEF)-like protein/PAS domain S-box-containing protein
VEPDTEPTGLVSERQPHRQIVESAPVGILIHRAGRIVFSNPEAASIVGAGEPEDLVGREVIDFVHPGERERAAERIRTVREEGNEAEPVELRARRLDGGTIVVESRGIPITHEGSPAVLLLIRDVTDRVRAERALAESEDRYRRLFEEVHDAVYVSDPDGEILDVNPAAEELFGYSREEILEMDARDLYVDPGERRRWKETVEEEGHVEDFELRLRRKDGREMLCVETATVRRGPDGEVMGYQGIIRDITERRKFQEELEHQALHDGLTDLPNRTLFWDRLEHALAHRDRDGRTLAVLFADLDHFKSVNDSLGHGAGDEVLVQVADRFRRCFRDEDTVARVGGDEFTVLFESLESVEQAAEGAERLLWLLQEPIPVDDAEVEISASVGLATYSAAEESSDRSHRELADALVRAADDAMYRAKDQGGSRYLVGRLADLA